MTAYMLKLHRIPFAIGTGAIAGAAVVAGWFVEWRYVFDPATRLQAFEATPLVFLFALVLWALGLAVIGGPAWVYLHRRGRISPANALSLGLGATFVVTLALNHLLTSGVVSLTQDGHSLIEHGRRTPYGLFKLWSDSVFLSLLGGVVGTVVWRVAYRRAG